MDANKDTMQSIASETIAVTDAVSTSIADTTMELFAQYKDPFTTAVIRLSDKWTKKAAANGLTLGAWAANLAATVLSTTYQNFAPIRNDVNQFIATGDNSLAMMLRSMQVGFGMSKSMVDTAHRAWNVDVNNYYDTAIVAFQIRVLNNLVPPFFDMPDDVPDYDLSKQLAIQLTGPYSAQQSTFTSQANYDKAIDYRAQMLLGLSRYTVYLSHSMGSVATGGDGNHWDKKIYFTSLAGVVIVGTALWLWLLVFVFRSCSWCGGCCTPKSKTTATYSSVDTSPVLVSRTLKPAPKGAAYSQDEDTDMQEGGAAAPEYANQAPQGMYSMQPPPQQLYYPTNYMPGQRMVVDDTQRLM